MADHITDLLADLQKLSEVFRESGFGGNSALIDRAYEAINAYKHSTETHVARLRQVLAEAVDNEKLTSMLMRQSSYRLGAIQRLEDSLSLAHKRYNLLTRVLRRDGYWSASMTEEQIDKSVDDAIAKGVLDVAR